VSEFAFYVPATCFKSALIVGLGGNKLRFELLPVLFGLHSNFSLPFGGDFREFPLPADEPILDGLLPCVQIEPLLLRFAVLAFVLLFKGCPIGLQLLFPFAEVFLTLGNFFHFGLQGDLRISDKSLELCHSGIELVFAVIEIVLPVCYRFGSAGTVMAGTVMAGKVGKRF